MKNWISQYVCNFDVSEFLLSLQKLHFAEFLNLFFQKVFERDCFFSNVKTFYDLDKKETLLCLFRTISECEFVHCCPLHSCEVSLLFNVAVSVNWKTFLIHSEIHMHMLMHFACKQRG